MTTFHITKSSDDISDLSNIYEDLARKIPCDLWNLYITIDVMLNQI